MDGLEPVLQTQRFISSLSILVICLSLSRYPTALVMWVLEGEISLIGLHIWTLGSELWGLFGGGHGSLGGGASLEEVRHRRRAFGVGSLVYVLLPVLILCFLCVNQTWLTSSFSCLQVFLDCCLHLPTMVHTHSSETIAETDPNENFPHRHIHLNA